MRKSELREILATERLHEGMASESLIEKMLAAPAGADPWSLDLTDAERSLLSVCLSDKEGVNSDTIDDVVKTLRFEKLQQERDSWTSRLQQGGDVKTCQFMIVDCDYRTALLHGAAAKVVVETKVENENREYKKLAKRIHDWIQQQKGV